MGLEIRIFDSDWILGIIIWDRYWGLKLEIRIEGWDWGLRIGIGDWGLGIGDLGLRIVIGEWELGLAFGIWHLIFLRTSDNHFFQFSTGNSTLLYSAQTIDISSYSSKQKLYIYTRIV